jgi:hypothetical protein
VLLIDALLDDRSTSTLVLNTPARGLSLTGKKLDNLPFF